MELKEKIQLLEKVQLILEEIGLDNQLAFAFHATFAINETDLGDNCAIGITSGTEELFVNSFNMHYDPKDCDIGTMIMLLKSIDLLFQRLGFNDFSLGVIRAQMCLATDTNMRFFSMHKRIKNDGTILN